METTDYRLALEVGGYGGHDTEPFESYLKRWPASLSNFPSAVVKDWVWRHWGDFRHLWLDRGIEELRFDLNTYDDAEILQIGQFERWDDLADRHLDPKDPLNFSLGRYMVEHGTFPVPIIVATNSHGLIHPRGYPMQPLHLIEGHRRLGMLRGLLKREHPTLVGSYQVWNLVLPIAHFLPSSDPSR